MQTPPSPSSGREGAKPHGGTIRIAPASAPVIVRRRPQRSEIHPHNVPPRIAPAIDTAEIPATAATLNPRWRLRNVGYMSCVPCEAKFIVIMNTAMYRNSFQFDVIAEPSWLQLSLLLTSNWKLFLYIAVF